MILVKQTVIHYIEFMQNINTLYRAALNQMDSKTRLQRSFALFDELYEMLLYKHKKLSPPLTNEDLRRRVAAKRKPFIKTVFFSFLIKKHL